jgi:hypothetical protein
VETVAVSMTPLHPRQAIATVVVVWHLRNLAVLDLVLEQAMKDLWKGVHPWT